MLLCLLLEPLNLKLNSRTEVRVKTDQLLSFAAQFGIAKTLCSSAVLKL